MNIQTPDRSQLANCEPHQDVAAANAHLALNSRARGVRFARIRCRLVWNDTLYTRDARQFFQSVIRNP